MYFQIKHGVNIKTVVLVVNCYVEWDAKTPWSWGRMHDSCAFSRKVWGIETRCQPFLLNKRPFDAWKKRRRIWKRMKKEQARPWTTLDAWARSENISLDPKLLKKREQETRFEGRESNDHLTREAFEKRKLKQERSVGGTSSLNSYQSSCPRRDGEKNIKYVHY